MKYFLIKSGAMLSSQLTDRTIHLKDGVVVGESSKEAESVNEVETIVTDGDNLSLV